jgi:hypothetical protein
MKRTNCIVFFLLCFGISVGFVSCQKSTVTNPSVRIIGKWKKANYATDDNVNGVIDSWEMRKASTAVVNVLEFKKDNSGIETSTGSPYLGFSWSLSGGLLKITYNTGDAFSYNVMLLNSAKLNITAKTSVGLAGYYYESQ